MNRCDEKCVENSRRTCAEHGHGGDLLGASRRFHLPPERFIDFSSNINPLGPPPGLLKHLRAHLGEITCYPPPRAAVFCRELAGQLKLPEERLLAGNGANELLHLLFLYLRPRRVILPAPCFAEYRRAAALVGAEIVDFAFPPSCTGEEPVLPAGFGGADLLVLCNPHNPTGAYCSRPFLEKTVREAARHGATVVLDESFFALTGRPQEESLASWEQDNLWVVVSLTKVWALPGLRLGYLAGPRRQVAVLAGSGDPWRVNTLAQRAGLYCLRQTRYLERSIEVIRRERAYLTEALARIAGLQVFPAAANFLLLKGTAAGFKAAALFDCLGRRGLLIRDAANFVGLDETYFRIAVRRRRENRRLLAALSAYFDACQTKGVDDNDRLRENL